MTDVNGIISDENLPESYISHCEGKEVEVIVKVGERFDRNRNTESRH